MTTGADADVDVQLVDDVCRAVLDRLDGAEGAPVLGDAVEAAVRAEVRSRAPLLNAAQAGRVGDRALARLTGLAELEPFVDDETVDEVLVTGERIWVDRRGHLEPVGTLGATTVELLVERILAPIGRRVDRTSPIVDARLPDGARVCAVVPPVAVDGATLSIRRFARRARALDEFTDEIGRALLADVVAARANVVVCGATSSGKTSLLAALVAAVDPAERLLVLEDTAELACVAPHLVRLEARPAGHEGLPPIGLDQLVRTALRLRPDRLVVGEVRGDEVLGLVQAMNTGHDGSFSTCHANGPLDALLRLESLVLQAAPQWPLAAVRAQLARSIDVVVHVARAGSGARRVESIDEVVPPDPDAPDATPRLRSLGRMADGGIRRGGSLSRRRR